MNTPLPVTIIGGYLGAGKTTLVNQMLRQADGKKLAILVNEFGTLPIDEDLIEAQDDALISIAGGCICCAFGSDLNAAMLQLADLPGRPDHVVIESSGVALPGAIANSIAILEGFVVDGICVLADCQTIAAHIADEYIGDTITRQMSDADMIVLNKTDLVTEAARDATMARIAESWPTTRVIPAEQGNVPNSVILGHMNPDLLRKSQKHTQLDFVSIVLTPDAPVDAHALARTLSDPKLGVIRAKGYVDDHSGRRALIQIVGPRAEVSSPATTGSIGLVCIGQRDRFPHRRCAAAGATRVCIHLKHGIWVVQGRSEAHFKGEVDALTSARRQFSRE